EPALGGLVYVHINQGKIKQLEILAEYPEARGLDYKNNKILISSENTVYEIDLNKKKIKNFDNPWFSYIHTVKYNGLADRFLVASSGVDTIIECDADNGKEINQWNAWEKGMDEGENPKTGEKHYLTRDPKRARFLEEKGKKVFLIQNPQKEQLPTAMRAAFINSAEYDESGRILLTFFHEGYVKRFSFNKTETETETVFKEMQKPHGARQCGSSYIVTDTAGGKVLMLSKETLLNYDFNQLSGKSSEMADMEWLQTSHCLGNVIVTVDSNRHSLVFISPKNKKRLLVPFNDNWAVQDLVGFKGDIEILKSVIKININYFNK
ncbi:hypothetical protein KAJ27_04140, partial [bacterium]|nr:hypothetical protein [bacterium]